MKLATWNVNGVRAREEQLLAWLDVEKPDVFCLQEIKIQAAQLTLGLGSMADYVGHWHGSGAYSGVSLHFKKSLFGDAIRFEHPSFDHECRVVEAALGGVRFTSMYLPNGGKDYPAKVAFLKAFAEHVAEVRGRGEPMIVMGDLNVAREDRDVYPNQRKVEMLGQKKEERELFQRVLDAGLVDVQRKLHPDDDRIYTWWPYWRNLREKNQGWRIDYVLASADLARRMTSCVSQREVGTSDHAPVVAVME